MQFPIEQPVPQNKLSDNINNAMSIYSQLQQAMAAPEQMKMQRAIQQANLQKQQMANRYYPQDIQSQIALREAQANLAPVNTAVSLQNSLTNAAQNRRMGEQRNWAWALQRSLSALPQAARDAWIADNQPAYNAMIKSIMESGQNPSAAAPMILTPQFLQQHGFSAGGQQNGSPQINQMIPPNAAQGTPTVSQTWVPPGSPQGIPPSAPQGAMQGTQIQGTPAMVQQRAPQVVPQGAPQNVQPLNAPAMVGANLANAPTNAQQTLTPEQMQSIGKVLAGSPAANPEQADMMPPASEGQEAPDWIDPETGRPQIQIGGQQPKFTPEQRQEVATMMAANSSGTGPDIQRRMRSAMALSEFMYDPEIQKELVTLSKYPGLIGKSEAYLKSHLKPAEMAEYNSAKNRLPILISGSMKGVENLPTSTIGMQAGGDFLNISQNQKAWVSDPDATLKDWLSAYKLADAEERAIIKTAQPFYDVYKLPKNPPEIIQGALSKKPSSIGESLSQKVGAPNAQAAAPINIPTFNSKAEFQKWYTAKSPAERAAIKQQMGNQ